MSLFGKVLAFLNVAGAVAFFCLASLDYAKRRAWEYEVFRHELMLNGLPLDKEERTPEGQPRYELIGEPTQQAIFASVGGNPVTTQEAEVQNLQNTLDSRIRGAGKDQQLYQSARVLLPLAETNFEREQLQAYRAHFATKAAAAALKKRYQEAFAQAVRLPAEDDPVKTFAGRFRRAVNDLAQGGEPSEVLTAALLRALPEADTPEGLKKNFAAVNFDKVYDATLDPERARLQNNLAQAFATALRGERLGATEPGMKALTPEARRGSIARLLFKLAPVRAEDAIDAQQGETADRKLVGALPRDSSAFADKLLDTEAYKTAFKRVQTVVGVHSTVAAVGLQARVLRKVAGELASAVQQGRLAFMAAHQQLLDQIQTRALDVEAEAALRARKQKQVADQQVLVNKRQKDVDWYETQLKESWAETAKRWKELREMSQALHDLRVKVRDALAENERAEKVIRTYEGRLRELEGSR
jgi:hypothetical protein